MTTRTIGIPDAAPDREADRSAFLCRGWTLQDGSCQWAVADGTGSLLATGLEPDRAAAERALRATRAAAAPPAHPLTAPQVARLLGVDVRTVRSWARRGQLRPLAEATGGRSLYLVADVLRCEAARRAASRAVTDLLSPEAPPALVARARKAFTTA